MRFEWDEARSCSNLKKHGISLELAREVFSDPFCLTIQDQMDRAEQRYWTIGRIAKLTVVLVVHTMRDQDGEDPIRIFQHERRHRRSDGSMKKLTIKLRRKQLEFLTALPDAEIDTSDIPELTVEQLKRAVRGQMYRPVKRPVTMRLDADIIAWLKQGGPGYQTKANSLLRREMLRTLRQRRSPGPVPKQSKSTTSKTSARRVSRPA